MPPSPDLPPPAPQAPNFVTDEELASAVDQLPPALRVLWRLLCVLRDPNSTVEDTARIIRVDTALTAQMLKLANSPFYGLPRRISSLDEAIQHVGVEEVSRLASTLSSRQLFMRRLDYYGVEADLLWQHTIAVAVAAEAVARLFLTEPEIAYLAGLLHPVGMVALDALAPLRPKPHLPWAPSLLEREAHRFGAHNAAIAERVLRLWVLPEDLVAAVGRRYEVPTAETIAKQGHELYLASHVAECAQVGLPVENGLFPLPEEKLRELGLRKEMFAELELEVAERVTRLQAALEPV